MRVRGIFRFWRAGAVVLLPALVACSSGLDGRYADDNNMMSYEFKSGGKVYMKTMGLEVAGKYEIDGQKVTVIGPHGSMVYELKDGNLVGPMGLTLTKRE